MIKIFYILVGVLNQIFVQIQLSAKNPIHRIAAQISIFQTGSFIFIQLDNYFQGLTYIIVYVGAIAILFQFVIMLIEHPSVGYHYEINNIIKDHNSVLTYKIKNIYYFNKNKKKELSINNYNSIEIDSQFKQKTEIYYNFKDILNYYNKNLNFYEISIKKNNIKNNQIKNLSSIFFFLSVFYGTDGTGYNDPNTGKYQQIENPKFDAVTIKIEKFIDMLSTSIEENFFEIYTYFYPTWAIEFQTLTDIEIFGILIYVAYPIAQIQISLALWIVMIGIISICSPRR